MELKKTFLFTTVFVFIFLVITEKYSYAYIDPGTTSVVFSSLAYVLAAIAGGLSFLVYHFKRIVGFFSRVFSSKSPNTND